MRESKKWWREKDSNLRRLSRQIYSLIPLATREPLHKLSLLALQLTFKIVFQNIINNGLVYQDKTKHWPCLVFENDYLR